MNRDKAFVILVVFCTSKCAVELGSFILNSYRFVPTGINKLYLCHCTGVDKCFRSLWSFCNLLIESAWNGTMIAHQEMHKWVLISMPLKTLADCLLFCRKFDDFIWELLLHANLQSYDAVDCFFQNALPFFFSQIRYYISSFVDTSSISMNFVNFALVLGIVVVVFLVYFSYLIILVLVRLFKFFLLPLLKIIRRAINHRRLIVLRSRRL